MIITTLPARLMSWNSSALKKICPVVGSDSTIAVTVSPEKIAGRIHAAELITGLSATRTGYLNSSRPSFIPLVRAVTTYCLRNSSSRLARTMRISSAVPAVPITTIGIGRCLSMSHARARLHGAATYSAENRPVRLTPNHASASHISTSASRKLGVARPKNPEKVNR